MAQRSSSKCKLRTKEIFIAFLITPFAASYILADNRLPLACSGMAEADLVQDIVRLVLWSVNVLLGIIVFASWCCYVQKRKYVPSRELWYVCCHRLRVCNV